MELHKLDFANIVILRADIAEVVVHDGVEITQVMVDQYHDFLLEHLATPFSLLINKLHSYTYDFSAQKSIANLEQIKAIAVVVYNEISKASTESLINFPREKPWNIEMFSGREMALEWLIAEHDEIDAQINHS